MIASMLEKQEEIYSLVEELRDNWENEQKILEIFTSAPQHCLVHPQISSLFTDFLQLPIAESILTTNDLKSIEKIYEMNIALMANDLSHYEELAHFYTSVYDDEKKALKTIRIGVKNAKATLGNLRRIRNALEE